MQKIKNYFNSNNKLNMYFLAVGVAFIFVGIALNDISTWIALSTVFFVLSGTTYAKPDKK